MSFNRIPFRPQLNLLNLMLLLLLMASCQNDGKQAKRQDGHADEEQNHDSADAWLPTPIEYLRLPGVGYKVRWSGKAMGTSYQVTYLHPGETGHADDESSFKALAEQYRQSMDSLLEAFNACLSTYDNQSTLSRWNHSNGEIVFEGECGQWIRELYHLSYAVWQQSDGAFDPSVLPLVRAWGFLQEDPFEQANAPDSAEITELLAMVGFGSGIRMVEESRGVRLSKANPKSELDFNAIAKGYGVDLLSSYLWSQGIDRSLVDIGGELMARGKNERNTPWKIAVEKPLEQERELQALVSISQVGMATSGNYRRYWEKDGLKYGHTLNPKTGYPEMSSLLSASVIASDCASADAYATACMVLGLQKGLDLIESRPELEAYFVYLDVEGQHAVMQSTGYSRYRAE